MKMVESTLLIPLTIMIIMTIIGIMMTFYGSLERAAETHAEMRESIYETEINW